MKQLHSLVMLALFCLIFSKITVAQQPPSKEVRDKLQKAYNSIKKPEISFEKFLEINAHVYASKAPQQKLAAAAASQPQDVYCAKVRPYCTNSDFETGLDQNAYTGAYGFWFNGLYPDPFGLTYGFSSGSLYSSDAHQTIVKKSDGPDPITGISVVPSNGGKQSLRLGNAVYGNGTELVAKTVKVVANESILGFYYAVVLQDPGHARDDQPAFLVRVYDCATGLELPNVCNLGNGSNLAVADSKNPFFKTTSYQGDSLVYRDWSRVQIDLSKYVGKNITIVFTVKDCNLGAHFGYAYIDNLFSTSCLPPLDPNSPKEGDVQLRTSKTDTCGTGNICASYVLPYLESSSGKRTNGTATIALGIYQNGSLVKTINSPVLSTYSADSTYCFSINPSTLGINSSLAGFDYTITGNFKFTGFVLSPKIVGNPGVGQKAEMNNDYLVKCPIIVGDIYYSKPSGDLHNVLTWGDKPDGSGANPPNFGAGKTFQLANRPSNYTMTANWTVGGKLNIPSSSQLQIGNYTLSIADLLGTGSLSGTTMSNLFVTTPSSGGTSLKFATGSNNLSNLTLNSGSGTSLAAALNIYGVLNVQTGSFNTSNVLTLKSTSTNTARVAPVKGSITGTATVERYVPARRAWRLVNSPVGGNQTISAAWQEGATTSSPNPNPFPGYGTHITKGTVAAGFDQNPNEKHMASIKSYNNVTDSWIPLTNTNATPLAGKPYMLFVRGNRSVMMNGPDVPANNTVLRAKGSLNVGNQSYAVAAKGFTPIPNPFASPINFASLTRTNVQNNFYLWDPKLGGTFGVGAFVNVSFNGVSYDVTPAAASPESQFIQSGQSFLVRSTGSSGTLTIKESDKSSTPAINVLGVVLGNSATLSGPAGLRVGLNTINGDSSATLLDEIYSSYDPAFSDQIDDMDAEKVPNALENLSINRDHHQLMVERRASLTNGEHIRLGLWNTESKGYFLQVRPEGLAKAGLYAFLIDKLQGVVTPVSLKEESRVFFNCSQDTSSASTERFEIVLSNDSKFNPFAQSNRLNAVVYPNPITGTSVNVHLTNAAQGIYQATLTNNVGQVILRKAITHGGGTGLLAIPLAKQLAKGVYYLDLTNGDKKVTLNLLSK